MSQQRIKLNNELEIPAIGLGTWQSKPDEVRRAVAYALKDVGYRHIDCAFAYGNEAEVGQGIKDSGVPRSEIWLTSKIWCTYHSRVEESVEKTLKDLQTDYIDLLLVHWPVHLNPKGNHPFFPTLPDGTRDVVRDWELKNTWTQMEAVLRSGKAKAIGVSNFSQLKLDEILPTATIIPAVNQLEIHPYNPQLKLVAYNASKGIVTQAYSPLGSTNSPLLSDPDILKIAEKYKVDPSAILIAWLTAKNIVALPKSVTPARIEANFKNPQAVKLTDEDIKLIDSLAGEKGKQNRIIKPPWPVVLGFEDWI